MLFHVSVFQTPCKVAAVEAARPAQILLQDWRTLCPRQPSAEGTDLSFPSHAPFLGHPTSSDCSAEGLRTWPPYSDSGHFGRAIPALRLLAGLAEAFIDTVLQPHFSLRLILLPPPIPHPSLPLPSPSLLFPSQLMIPRALANKPPSCMLVHIAVGFPPQGIQPVRMIPVLKVEKLNISDSTLIAQVHHLMRDGQWPELRTSRCYSMDTSVLGKGDRKMNKAPTLLSPRRSE